MFILKAPATFPATLTIIGQGREQTLKLVYRHKAVDRLKEMEQQGLSLAEMVLDVVESWEADMPLNAESVALLQQEQPGADLAIITGYAQAMAVARKGN